MDPGYLPEPAIRRLKEIAKAEDVSDESFIKSLYETAYSIVRCHGREKVNNQDLIDTAKAMAPYNEK